MRVVCLSDTHGYHGELDLPPGDCLVHTGDVCRLSKLEDFKMFLEWFAVQPHKYKVFCAGNHDWPLQTQHGATRKLLRKHPEVTYLQDATAMIGGVEFYGFPWQPQYYDWAFNLPRNGYEMQQKVNKIPDTTEVLLSHGPPFGRFDTRDGNERFGCELLAERITQLPKLRLHVFGHSHTPGMAEVGQLTYVNAAICTPAPYWPGYPVQWIDI